MKLVLAILGFTCVSLSSLPFAAPTNATSGNGSGKKQSAWCWQANTQIHRAITHGHVLVRQIEHILTRKVSKAALIEQQAEDVIDGVQRFVQAGEDKNARQIDVEGQSLRRLLRQLWTTLHDVDADELASLDPKGLDLASFEELLPIARELLVRQNNIRQRFQSNFDLIHQWIGSFRALVGQFRQQRQVYGCQQRLHLADMLQEAVKELDNINTLLLHSDR